VGIASTAALAKPTASLTDRASLPMVSVPGLVTGPRAAHVVEQLQDLIAQNDLGDKVELGGTFCMGQCQKGVCVTVDDTFYSVSPEDVSEFFETNIKAKV
jgi:(2Fe-2S) ferredoxin